MYCSHYQLHSCWSASSILSAKTILQVTLHKNDSTQWGMQILNLGKIERWYLVTSLLFKASWSNCHHVYFCVVMSLFSYRTEKDKAPPSPYLTINNKGDVEVQNDQVLVSTCRMQVYKFPFDIQSCNLSFKSVIHTGERAMSLLRHECKFGTASEREPMLGVDAKKNWCVTVLMSRGKHVVHFNKLVCCNWLNQSRTVVCNCVL